MAFKRGKDGEAGLKASAPQKKTAAPPPHKQPTKNQPCSPMDRSGEAAEGAGEDSRRHAGARGDGEEGGRQGGEAM